MPRFFHGTGHEPLDGVLLPAHSSHDLGQRRSVLALERGHHQGRFTAFARSRAKTAEAKKVSGAWWG